VGGHALIFFVMSTEVETSLTILLTAAPDPEIVRDFSTPLEMTEFAPGEAASASASFQHPFWNKGFPDRLIISVMSKIRF